MTDPTVPPTKPAGDLEPGDYVIASDLYREAEGITEVLLSKPFGVPGRRDTMVIVSDGDLYEPESYRLPIDKPVRLASAQEVAEKEAAERRERVAGALRELADMVLNHELPIGGSYSEPVVSFRLGRDVAAVERVAEVLGLEVDRQDRTAQAWMGVQDRAPLTVYWSASLPKEAAPVVEPDPDPTGLAYSRADDADDPTPVSPGRVPLHTGGVVDGGRLVDETPAESEGVFNGLPDCSPACERQVLTQDTKHLADCPRSVALIARFGTSKAGQPREPQAADTVPVPAEDATLTRLPEAEDETPVNLMDQTGPCVASLHIPAPGVACGICGAEGMRSAQHVQVDGTASSDGCEAECACGAVFAGDTPAEVRELLTRHVRQARSGAPSA
jgi:hypothetical protein